MLAVPLNSYSSDRQQGQSQRPCQIFSLFASVTLVGLLFGCTMQTTNQYEATARTTYTWQVRYYANQSRRDRDARLESLASTSLLSRNGEKPESAVIGPDDKGLWWPAIPPKPTLDEIEKRQRSYETASPPELLQKVDYQISYNNGEKMVSLPTNHDVYREVVKAYPTRTPLELTLGVEDRSVEKAEPR